MYKFCHLLMKEGKITEEHLEMALNEQRRTKEHIGKILNRLGFITRADLTCALAFQAGVKFVGLLPIEWVQISQKISERPVHQGV